MGATYGGLGAVPPAGIQGAEPPVEGQGAGSILAAEGPLEKAFCPIRTLETTRLDGSYLHCDFTVGYIEIRKVSAIYRLSYVY